MSNFTGPQIRTKREQLGLTAGQLASMLDISKANLYKWEKGHLPSNPKDYIKVESWLKGKVESVPRATTATETPQNGQKNSPHPTLTEIGELVKKIQYVTNFTIEQIADRIKWSRPYLNTLLKYGESKKALSRLKIAFAKELAQAPELTTTTNKPVFDVKPSGTQDKDVTIKNLSEVIKSQQDLLAETNGKLITLVSKVIEKL